MTIKSLVKILIIFYFTLVVCSTLTIYYTHQEYDKLNTIYDTQLVEINKYMQTNGESELLKKLKTTEQEIQKLNKNIDYNLVFIYGIMILASVSFIFTYSEMRRKILKPIFDMNEIILAFQNGSKDVQEIKSNDDEIGLMIKEFFVMKGMLDKDYEEIQKVASTDPLTGALNRRAFFDITEKVAQLAFRNNETFAVAIIDIDHFKSVNDTYGHLIGDEVIKYLVNQVDSNIRESDIFARYGGEEFIIFLPKTDADGAFLLANKIRESVESTPFHKDGIGIPLTISIGVAELRDEKLLRELIKRADTALYTAKEGGRNRVEHG